MQRLVYFIYLLVMTTFSFLSGVHFLLCFDLSKQNFEFGKSHVLIHILFPMLWEKKKEMEGREEKEKRERKAKEGRKGGRKRRERKKKRKEGRKEGRKEREGEEKYVKTEFRRDVGQIVDSDHILWKRIQMI